MLKSVSIAVTVFLSVLTPVLAAPPATPVGATAPSKDEVVVRVNKAVEFYRQNGRDKTIAELNRRDGAFAKGVDYVDLHDINGVCIAHPRSPDLVGQNRLDSADPQGQRLIREIIEAAKTRQDGWVRYQRENPNNGEIEHKIAYWAVHDGLIFKAGTYDSSG